MDASKHAHKKKSKRMKRSDRTLLQELLSLSRSDLAEPNAQAEEGYQTLHKEMAGCERTKEQLAEIEGLLIKAYRDLELMGADS